MKKVAVGLKMLRPTPASWPELLEACYAALELRCPDGDEHECRTFAVINDAIAKAEGK